MTDRDDRNRDEIRSRLGPETSLAREVVESVLDLHHEFKGCCYECSTHAYGPASFPSSPWPCRTVRRVREAVGLVAEIPRSKG